MITITIGSDTQRTYSGHETNRWIAQQIERRNRDNHPYCLLLNISEGDINVTLSAGTCPGGAGGRMPNRKEEKILSLWNHIDFDSKPINPGLVISFLNKLGGLL